MTGSIGGYFELELRSGEHYHKDALKLNTARNCLEYILKVREYKKVYIPYYTCDVILEPLLKSGIKYEYYSINEYLDPVTDIILSQNEALLYTNYFGLKQTTVIELANRHKNLIIDNAQAFYSEALAGTDTFYSPRKFFGVPDGAYLYIDTYLEDELEQDVSYKRMEHLLKRIDLSPEIGYNDFKKNDESLINQPIKRMSSLTQRILSSIDYENAKKKRISNYLYLHHYLGPTNNFSFGLTNEDIPMVYPYWVENSEKIKEHLISNKIYTATYWPNSFEWCKPDSLEYLMAKNIIFLPIDQRYDEVQMKYIVQLINEYK